jgi:hypothetical protein
LNCTIGSYSKLRSIACDICFPGKYSTTYAASSSEACINCVPGTYSTGFGVDQASSCLPCLEGTMSSAPGASSSGDCGACLPGTYASSTSSTSCQLCSPGKYAPNSRSLNCFACTYGKFSPIGALSCTALNNCSAIKYQFSFGICKDKEISVRTCTSGDESVDIVLQEQAPYIPLISLGRSNLSDCKQKVDETCKVMGAKVFH